jgi:hypothetical protein
MDHSSEPSADRDRQRGFVAHLLLTAGVAAHRLRKLVFKLLSSVNFVEHRTPRGKEAGR